MRHFQLTLPFSSYCSLIVLYTEYGLFVFRSHHWIVFLQQYIHSPSQTLYTFQSNRSFQLFSLHCCLFLEKPPPLAFSKSAPFYAFFLEENGLLILKHLHEYPPNSFSSELKRSTEMFIAWELFRNFALIFLICFVLMFIPRYLLLDQYPVSIRKSMLHWMILV